MVRRNLTAKNKTTSLKSLISSSARGRSSKMRKANRWNDVHEEKKFWVNDGSILKNLKELPDALKQMSDETFMHHVNENKNDFANWVEDVVGERKLARELRSLNSRAAMMTAVKRRL